MAKKSSQSIHEFPLSVRKGKSDLELNHENRDIFYLNSRASFRESEPI